MNHNELKLAVLIDADNVPRNSIKAIMEEIAVYGTPTIKRIYGDWAGPHVAGWKNALLEHALTPVQQYGYTTGKNSTDSAMIIDAMDILYADKIDGFCIVSSDSDFTRLALRLRESGKKVIGFGEKKTPNPFIVACDKFIYIEVIRDKYGRNKVSRSGGAAASNVKTPMRTGSRAESRQTADAVTPSQSAAAAVRIAAPPDVPAEVDAAQFLTPEPIPDSVITLLADSLADVADEDGYAFMGELGNLLLKKQPDFDPRNFGYLKLTSLIKAIPRFEVDIRQTRDKHIKHIYLKDKEMSVNAQ